MNNSALSGIRILDLSRVLAGPYCTQMLADLGAEIIKIEKPGEGDDTRQWGPPFLKDKQGQDTGESAYYLSANRGKKSVAIDIKTAEGQELIHAMLGSCDILIENFKTGGLSKYGLGYQDIKDKYPTLIYCSITGFGQTGPLAAEPGYDFLAQGMTGLMACSGPAEEEPIKTGVAISDILTGLNAAIGILAALHHRTNTGEGQHIDLALTDCTLSAMTNIAQHYLTSGTLAPRVGNAHSTIVPYQAFETSDGHIIIAVGNNSQFTRLATLLGRAEWTQDPRFARNSDRVLHRDTLLSLIIPILKTRNTLEWLNDLREREIPAGPVNTMDKVFEEPQIAARDMKIAMTHPLCAEDVNLVGSPLKLSTTPVSYTLPPPVRGQHTAEIVSALPKMTRERLKALAQTGIIEIP